MATVLQNSKDVNCARKPYILFLSPNGCCWECERRPLPDPCVAVTLREATNREFFYLLCSIACAHVVIEELAPIGLRIITKFELSPLLETTGRPVAVVEGWRGADHPWYLVSEASDRQESN